MDSLAFNVGFQTKYILNPWYMLFIPVKVSLKGISILSKIHWVYWDFLYLVYRQAIPCTPDYQEINWQRLSYTENIPTPFKTLRIGLSILTLVLAIVIQIGRQRISLVIPLNQPKDLQSILPLGYFLIIFLTYGSIKS